MESSKDVIIGFSWATRNIFFKSTYGWLLKILVVIFEENHLRSLFLKKLKVSQVSKFEVNESFYSLYLPILVYALLVRT